MIGGVLDRYIGRIALGAYLATLMFMIFLSILIDMLMNLSEYIEVAQTFDSSLTGLIGYLAVYYAVLMPFLFVNVAPFVTVISCMFGVSRLMSTNEVMPMIFTGRSLFRVLRPVFLLAALSAALMAACWELVIPRLAGVKTTRELVLGSRIEAREVLLTSPSNERQHLRCESYYHDELRMEDLMLYDEGTGPGDAQIIEADVAIWRPDLENWELQGGIVHRGEDSEPRTLLDAEGFTPNLIFRSGKETKETAELSYSDLRELQRLRPQSRGYVLAFQHHVTLPLANLILLLLSLPFALQFERGSKIERVVYAILICASYFVLDLICQSLGQQGNLQPLVAAWIPTILFGSLGLVFFSGIRT